MTRRTKIAPTLTRLVESVVVPVDGDLSMRAVRDELRALVAVARAAEELKCEPLPVGMKHHPRCKTCEALSRLRRASGEGKP